MVTQKRLMFGFSILFFMVSTIMNGFSSPYRVSDLAFYPTGTKEQNISLYDELVTVTIKDDETFTCSSSYLLDNAGVDLRRQFCVFLTSPDGGHECSPPSDVSFSVDDKEVPYKTVCDLGKEGNRRTEYWYYIDVLCHGRKRTHITVNYTSSFEYINNAMVFCNSSNDIPVLNENTKMTVDIRNFSYDVWWIQDIRFSDRFVNTTEWHMRDALSGLTKLGQEKDWDVKKSGDSRWVIECRPGFVKKYGTAFSIKLLTDYAPDCFYTFFPDGSLDPGVSVASTYDRKNISNELMNPYELFLLTDKQLQKIRNAFYARYGYVFKNADLLNYYKTKNNDSGSYTMNNNFSNSMLSEIEVANIETIKKLEKTDDR